MQRVSSHILSHDLTLAFILEKKRTISLILSFLRNVALLA